MNKLKQFWSNLRTSFWFIPTLIVSVSIILAVALVAVIITIVIFRGDPIFTTLQFALVPIFFSEIFPGKFQTYYSERI